MPIPFILGAAAAIAAGVGIKNGLDAKEKNNKAERINRAAQDVLDIAKKKADEARKAANVSLETFGRTRAEVYTNTMKDFIYNFKKIHNIDYKGSEFKEGTCFRDKDIPELEKGCDLATAVLSGAGGGAVAGALTAFGAYSAVGAFAAASTGTAIAGLSGVAATNATLAFLGGGALAAGGGGIALGTAVLGGLIAGPALAVLGWSMSSKADENLDKARANKAKAKEMEAELDVVTTKCTAIMGQAYRYNSLCRRLGTILDRKTDELKGVISSFGDDYRSYPQYAKEKVAIAMASAAATKSVLEVPILTKQGDISPQAQSKYTALMEKASELDA